MNEILGVGPELRKYMAVQEKALAGDMVLSASPATVRATAQGTGVARTRTVKFFLKTAAGEIHNWFNKSMTTKLTIADNTTSTATIPSTTAVFVDGICSVVVSCSPGTCANGQTNTLTLKNFSVMGSNLATVTSVETFYT